MAASPTPATRPPESLSGKSSTVPSHRRASGKKSAPEKSRTARPGHRLGTRQILRAGNSLAGDDPASTAIAKEKMASWDGLRVLLRQRQKIRLTRVDERRAFLADGDDSPLAQLIADDQS